MKRTFIIAIAIASSSMISAQDKTDTLTVVGPREVLVISNDTSQTVSIKGSADDPKYTYYRRVDVGKGGNVHESEKIGMIDFSVPFDRKPKNQKKAVFEAGCFNITGGSMVSINPNPYDFEYGVSGKFGFSVFRYTSRPITPFFNVTASLGWGFTKFTSEDDTIYHKIDGGLAAVPVPEGMDLKRSVVWISSFEIPIMFNFYSKKDLFGVSFGPVLKHNLNSWIRNVYTMNGGKKQKVREKNIHHKPVGLDYMAMIRLSGLGFFVQWSPHGIFDTAYNTDFSTVMVGMVLDFDW